jgi:hypothetical protein
MPEVIKRSVVRLLRVSRSSPGADDSGLAHHSYIHICQVNVWKRQNELFKGWKLCFEKIRKALKRTYPRFKACLDQRY